MSGTLKWRKICDTYRKVVYNYYVKLSANSLEKKFKLNGELHKMQSNFNKS